MLEGAYLWDDARSGRQWSEAENMGAISWTRGADKHHKGVR